MTWQQWLLAGLVALSSLIGIARVGKPREPITPGEAVFIALFNGAIIALIISI